jgi:hypothetical protein
MRLVQILLLFGFVVSIHGGKVKWDENGKPIIEQSEKPVKGCNKESLNSIVEDDNSSSKCT